MRRIVQSLLTAAVVSVPLATSLAAGANAAGTRAFDTVVPLRCSLDPRPAVPDRAQLPLSLRVSGVTDATASPGDTVQFSALQASLVLAPGAADVLAGFGADTLSGSLSSAVLYSSADPYFGYLITPNENRLVSIPETRVSGVEPTEIPLADPDLNTAAGPVALGDNASVAILDLGGTITLRSSTNAAPPVDYDLICFDNEFNTTLTTYEPAAPDPLTLPTITSVIGHPLARLGGVAIVSGQRLSGTTEVTVGTKRASFVQVTPSRLLVVAPPQPRGTYDVLVKSAAGTSLPASRATLTYR